MFSTLENQSLTRRLRLEVRGVVQGVGFRPFVYSVAHSLELKGFVGNESGGVLIEVEGATQNLHDFLRQLKTHAPPLAHVSEIEKRELEPLFETDFRIVESIGQPAQNTFVSPDVSVCENCLREMFDPSNRRYLYPFINCTNCGPRFTIQANIPYDRPNTTMNVFAMCAECRAEYENPRDRRFHAQPISCWNCGVQTWFQRLTVNGKWLAVNDQNKGLIETQRFLGNNQIIAVKGIGGFHLACDAGSDAAVSELRRRKGRVEKPFAVMCKDLQTAREFAEVSGREAALLESRAKPIVLLKKRNAKVLSDLVAPGNNSVGVMLAYSPLHHLLFHQFDGGQTPLPGLLMTSGNFSNEPIVKSNDEAIKKLSALADAFLLHDREIYVQCDDSVMRIVDGSELPVRRSRGYAPFPIELPFEFRREILAVGGEVKNCFALAKNNSVVMSPHLGDMENLETLAAFQNCLEQMKLLFRVEPEIVVGDLHPGYLSSNWAQAHLAEIARPNASFIRVQHHHAHIASVMAENGVLPDETVIGFAFDGTGYGTDGAIWGGEVVTANYREMTRRAHLGYVGLPGGDAAIKKPYRLALAYLHDAGIPFDAGLEPVKVCPPSELKILQRTFETNFNLVPTSSLGRLFDAVASLAGVRQTVNYEAQAAIEFEAFVDDTITDAYEFDWPAGETEQIGAKNLIRAVVADVQKQVAVSTISAKFHNAVGDLMCRLAVNLRASENINKIALSGGTFQNTRLLEAALKRLREKDFEVLTHSQVPPNDGGLALGQAVIANFLVSEN